MAGMNRILKSLLITMLNRRCIGEKHTPEKMIIRSKAKWCSRQEVKEFEKEYAR
ncbi:MAG: hypothetical protein V1659_02315 [Candidatus Woesearchaeota archaeon]